MVLFTLPERGDGTLISLGGLVSKLFEPLRPPASLPSALPASVSPQRFQRGLLRKYWCLFNLERPCVVYTVDIHGPEACKSAVK